MFSDQRQVHLARSCRAVNRAVVSGAQPAGLARLAQPPFRMLTLRTFDSPWIKIPVGTLRKGVVAALPVIAAGDKVLVYCRQGRHRSVAMASCILIGQGWPADEAMKLVKERRPIADPYAPHIESQIRAFAKSW